MCCVFFFFKQKTAYEMRISDWSSDVCSSDLIGRQFHGPMPVDIVREGGEAAVVRALRWLVDQDDESLEASVRATDKPVAEFNLTILSHLMGTPWLPDLSGHVLMLEDVGEDVYRIDRALEQVTSSPTVRVAAGSGLGQGRGIQPKDPYICVE